ncbi:MAG: PTS transporter subunit EIIB [Pseudonocardiaceae bacterium]
MTATSRRREPAPGRVEQTARDLLALLGGPDNIAEVSYCFTKLRLTLLNRAAADDTSLLAHPAVLGLIDDMTFQVITGPATVEPVAHALEALLPP